MGLLKTREVDLPLVHDFFPLSTDTLRQWGLPCEGSIPLRAICDLLNHHITEWNIAAHLSISIEDARAFMLEKWGFTPIPEWRYEMWVQTLIWGQGDESSERLIDRFHQVHPGFQRTVCAEGLTSCHNLKTFCVVTDRPVCLNHSLILHMPRLGLGYLNRGWRVSFSVLEKHPEVLECTMGLLSGYQEWRIYRGADTCSSSGRLCSPEQLDGEP